MQTSGNEGSNPMSPTPTPPARGTARPSGASAPKRWPAAIVTGVFNLLFIGVIIYLTYFFTIYISTRQTKFPSVAGADNAPAKKLAALRAEDRALLSSYSWANPVTKSVRIPIELAMELTAAEAAEPAPAQIATPAPEAVTVSLPDSAASTLTAAPSGAPAPVASAVTAPAADVAATEVPKATVETSATAPLATVANAAPSKPSTAPAARAPAGWTPAQLYQAVCIQCHGPDGKGTVVRLAMPTIPDLTDPKALATRTDADLIHSILEGKGQFMLARKDDLARVHVDPSAMAAYMRSFSGAKQPATVGAQTQPVPPQVAQLTVPAPVPGSVAPAANTTSPVSGQPAQSGSTPAPAPAPANAGPSPVSVVEAPTTTTSPPESGLPAWQQPAQTASTPVASSEPAPTAGAPSTSNTSAASPRTVTSLANAGTPPSTVSPSPAPEAAPSLPGAALVPPAPGLLTQPIVNRFAADKSAKMRMASDLFRQLNCISCHGPDGRGTLMRAAMPVIPDFTQGDWQAARTNPQLVSSVLDAKGVLMVPWRGKVTPDQAQALVAFVRGFGPPGATAASAGRTSDFSSKLSQLRQQMKELEQQDQALAAPSGADPKGTK